MRKLERSLEKKNKHKQELKEKLATIANKTILIKSEKRKLKDLETRNSRQELLVDRKFETNKIIQR